MAFNRRLVFWLLRAYIRKWGKVIVFSFFFGLAAFFLLSMSGKWLLKLIPIRHTETIGVVGTYYEDSLPALVSDKLSRGLTKVNSDGSVSPDVAASWQITDKGKTYIFKLKPNIYFSDGKLLTAKDIGYNFSSVKERVIDNQTIQFQLKDVYSPFLVTVSRPIFRDTYVGVGAYKVAALDLNDKFIHSITISPVNDPISTEQYIFYPSFEALKIAFELGEVREAGSLTDTMFGTTNFASYPNVTLTKKLDENQLVTLFFNTTDGDLSDIKLRDALSYALPDTFSEGQRAYLPYPEHTWYYNTDLQPKQHDLQHAQLLLTSSSIANNLKTTTLTITTLDKYTQTAQEIAKAWQKLGIKTKIETTDGVPQPGDFQIYLGDFMVPKDPDQYTLWHSGSDNNITRYKNLRIDKYLEDGRKSLNQAERQKIYFDFQKYLMDDQPAAFLYFPYEYTATRS